jgi:hypothetical protein
MSLLKRLTDGVPVLLFAEKKNQKQWRLYVRFFVSFHLGVDVM